MANLIDIVNSGASVELIVELLAKQIENRLTSLEKTGTMARESNVEKQLASVISQMSKLEPKINVSASAPVINVEPNVTVIEKEDKTKEDKGTERITMSFNRDLSGKIETATIIKSKD